MVEALFCIVVYGSLVFVWWYYRRRTRTPKVNMEILKDRLDEASEKKERLAMTDELLQDLDLTSASVVMKNITISWTDNVTGKEKELSFYIDGKTDTSKQLKNLAESIRKEASSDLMKIVYRLPKRRTATNTNEPE